MRAHFNFLVLTGLLLACDPDVAPEHEAQGEGLVLEDARPGCIERERAIDVAASGEPSRIARELIATLSGHHGAELRWLDGTVTRARLRIGATRAAEVQSRSDPERRVERGRNCEDRVRVYADFELESDDGRLHDSFLNAVFERGAGEPPHVSVRRKREQLEGAYIRQSSAALGVLSHVRLELAAIPLLFYGQVIEELGTADAGANHAAVGSFDPKLPRLSSDETLARDAGAPAMHDAALAASLDGGTNLADGSIGPSGSARDAEASGDSALALLD